MEAAWAAGLALVLGIAFLSPIFAHPQNWGIDDWDQHAFYHEAGRVSILEYGQLPQWNPYYCGGTDLLANPQSRVLDPTFPLVLWLGSFAGLKIQLLLFAAAGMLGLYALGRDLGLSPASAWIGPVVYFCGPTYALPASTGMTWIMATAYIPWVVLLVLRGFDSWRAAVGAGACLALMYYGGGVYPVLVTGTFLGFLALVSLRERRVVDAGRVLGLVLAVAVILGAAKIFPSAQFMREFPRRMDDPSGFSAQSLTFGLFHRDQRLEMRKAAFDGTHYDLPDRAWRGISTNFDDAGMYVGPVVAALFLIGLATSWRRLWMLCAAIPVFVWLSLGERPRASLFVALHKLPVFESMRYPERFKFIWLLAFGLFAGFGLQWLSGWLDRRAPGRRAGSIAVAAVAVLVIVDLFAVTRPIYRPAFPIPPIPVKRLDTFTQISDLEWYDAQGFRPEAASSIHGANSSHFPALLMNAGAVNCYETAFVPRKAIPSSSPEYKGEAFLAEGGGAVATAEWSPNRLRYTVNVWGPGVLVVNQNYASGWTAADGRPVTSRNGLISVKVGPEDRTVELRYGRKSFTAGLILSAVGWIAVAGIAIAKRK